MSRPPQDGSPEADALDVLIDQERKLLDEYTRRAAGADTLGAGALTAAAGLAILTVTIAGSERQETRALAAAALALLTIVVMITVIARSLAGLRPRFMTITLIARSVRRLPFRSGRPVTEKTRKQHLLSAESPEYRAALEGMRGFEKQLLRKPDTVDAVAARRHALMLWKQRADDAHGLAIKRELWAGAAGFALVAALLLLAVSQAWEAFS